MDTDTDNDARLGRSLSIRETPTLVAITIAIAIALLAFLRLGVFGGLLVAVAAAGAAGLAARTLARRQGTARARTLSRRQLLRALGAAGGDDAAAVVERLEQSLGSTEPSDVLYALDLLEKLGHPPGAERRAELFEHPSADVRKSVVDGAFDTPMLREAARRLLEQDPSPEVRAAAARSLCAAGDITDIDAIAPLLGHRVAAIRESALAGLLASRAVEASALGNQELDRLQTSTVPKDRTAAARILGRLGDPRLLPALERLLEDRDPMVRRQALESAARCPQAGTKLAPAALEALSDARTAGSAVAALVAHGAASVSQVTARYERADEATKRRILSVVGRIGGEPSVRFLWGVVENGSVDERRNALGWLVLLLSSSGRPRPDSKAQSLLRATVERELDAALWAAAASYDLIDESGSLRAALERELALSAERARHALTLLGVTDDEADLEATFGAEQASGLSGLLASPVDAQRLRSPSLASSYPQKIMTGDERLRAVVGRARWLSGWTRARALYDLSHKGGPGLERVVDDALSDPSPLVRETAVWAAARLEDGNAGSDSGRERRFQERLASACNDEAELVSRFASHMAELGAHARTTSS